MLEKCRRDQWSLEGLNWSQTPRSLSRFEEESIVQYFTNMAGIERLAGALFEEEGRRTHDPRLQEIFASFVRDEARHAEVAERLAHHYDRHHYRRYELDPNFRRFSPAFVEAIRHLTPEVANVYITTGELILDVALLRSLQSYVDDPLCDQAMHLINRDESRHIAIDFHMVEHYASPAYQAELARLPKPGLRERANGWWALSRLLFYARPFLRAVFFEPMDLVDPSGQRLLEAFRRIQIIANRSNVKERPFVRFMLLLQDAFRNPLLGFFFGRLLLRLIGTDARVIQKLYDEADLARAEAMSMDELCEEALALKNVG